MRPSFRVLSATAFSFAFSVLLSGCGITQPGASSEGQKSTLAVSGKLHGGQQPVSGATIQLYAASSTANQGASTPLLTAPVITATDGSFSITGDYTCPASNPLVYVVATGGNPGLPGTVNNPQLAMMALLGVCSTLQANAATTYTFIDELTTVASVQAVASFMTDYAHIGAAPSNPNGLSSAFDSATSLVDFSTGQFQGGGGAVDIPEVSMNTLSNIIAACINSSGGSSGSGTPCGQLLSLTNTTTDTITAVLHVTQTPGQNTTQLYNLIASNPPFQPFFTTVPTDFSSTVGYTIPTNIAGGTLDSNGHIWLYTGGYNYNTVTDTSTDSPGYITVYDNNFNQLFTVQPGTGGLYYPDSLVPDANGHVFAINANNTVSEFASNGAAISPSNGWSTGITPNFSPTASGDGFSYNENQVSPIAVDKLGNIFGATPYAYGSTQCYVELNSMGNISTPSGNFCSGSGISSFDDIATDGLGSAWVLGYPTIAKVDTNGNLAATAPTSVGCFNPTGSGAGTTTENILYDHYNNQLWGYSELGAGTITDSGAAVFCDYGSTTLPVSASTRSTSTTPGSAFSASSRLISNAVLDGQGNLWFVTGGVVQSGTVVNASPRTFTGTVTYSSYLSGVSPTGALLTPYNAANGTYGLQPAGLGTNATASVTNGSAAAAGISASLLGVDNNGNLWAADILTNRLFKISGVAKANTVNY